MTTFTQNQYKKMWRVLVKLLPIFAMLAFVLGANGVRALVIDFEYFPGDDGLLGTLDDVPIDPPPFFNQQTEQLSTQYEALGIVFTPSPPVNNKNEISLNGSFGDSISSGNNLLSTMRPGVGYPNYDYGPVEGLFTLPVYELSMSIGLWVTADDFWPGASNNLLEIFDENGLLLNSVVARNSFVTLSSTERIGSFRVSSTSIYAQAAIDNITFDPVVIPIPSTIIMIAFSILLLLLSPRPNMRRVRVGRT